LTAQDELGLAMTQTPALKLPKVVGSVQAAATCAALGFQLEVVINLNVTTWVKPFMYAAQRSHNTLWGPISLGAMVDGAKERSRRTP
jgi:hypothetical protein